MTEGLALAQRLQRALRAMAAQDCETVLVPPFAAYIDCENELPFFSYAIPQEGACVPWDQGPIDALKAVFRAAGRAPRVEIVAACWPGLAAALVTQGFGVEARLVGMTCAADGVVPGAGPPGLTLQRIDRGSDGALIAELLAVKWEPFEEMAGGAPADAAAIARYRRTGASSVLARTADGEVAGSASWLGVQDGVSEIVAVAVLAAFRGQGIAGALTAEAGRAAADAGADLLFLTYEDAGAGRVYERAGFAAAPACEALKLALPAC